MQSHLSCGSNCEVDKKIWIHLKRSWSGPCKWPQCFSLSISHSQCYITELKRPFPPSLLLPFQMHFSLFNTKVSGLNKGQRVRGEAWAHFFSKKKKPGSCHPNKLICCHIYLLLHNEEAFGNNQVKGTEWKLCLLVVVEVVKLVRTQCVRISLWLQKLLEELSQYRTASLSLSLSLYSVYGKTCYITRLHSSFLISAPKYTLPKWKVDERMRGTTRTPNPPTQEVRSDAFSSAFSVKTWATFSAQLGAARLNGGSWGGVAKSALLLSLL